VRPYVVRVLSLPELTREHHVLRYFSKYGQVLGCHMPRHFNNHRSNRLAFVEVVEEHAYKAIVKQKFHPDLGVNVQVVPEAEEIKYLGPRRSPSFTFMKIGRLIGLKHLHSLDPSAIDFHGFSGFVDGTQTPSISGAEAQAALEEKEAEKSKVRKMESQRYNAEELKKFEAERKNEQAALKRAQAPTPPADVPVSSKKAVVRKKHNGGPQRT